MGSIPSVSPSWVIQVSQQRPHGAEDMLMASTIPGTMSAAINGGVEAARSEHDLVGGSPGAQASALSHWPRCPTGHPHPRSMCPRVPGSIVDLTIHLMAPWSRQPSRRCSAAQQESPNQVAPRKSSANRRLLLRSRAFEVTTSAAIIRFPREWPRTSEPSNRYSKSLTPQRVARRQRQHATRRMSPGGGMSRSGHETPRRASVVCHRHHRLQTSRRNGERA